MKLFRVPKLFSSLKIGIMALLSLCCLPLGGCKIALPWRSISQAPPSQQVLVALTHGFLDSATRKGFDAYSRKIAKEMEAGAFAGLVGFSIRKEIFGDEVWTVSVWEDERALAAFIRSDLHQEAIQKTSHALVSMETHEVWLPASELPIDWDRVTELWNSSQKEEEAQSDG